MGVSVYDAADVVTVSAVVLVLAAVVLSVLFSRLSAIERTRLRPLFVSALRLISRLLKKGKRK